MRAEPLHKLQGAALLPHLPGYSGAEMTAAPGSWWEQLLDLDGAQIRQQEQRLDLDGAQIRQQEQLLDLDGAQIRHEDRRLDLDGAGIRQKAVLDRDGARDMEIPAVRGEHRDEYMSASKYMGHTRGHARGHARGLSVHAEL